MAGNRLALTERDRRVMAEISELGVASREQLTALGLFRSKTRANERLKRLTGHGYLKSLKYAQEAGAPRHLYALGLQAIGNDSVRRFSGSSQFFVRHQLGIGDVRVAFKTRLSLSRWLSDLDLAVLKLGVVPDAYLEYEVNDLTYANFLEYDRGTEPTGRIARKVEAYLKLAFSGQFSKILQRRFFRVLVVTDTPRRLSHLQSTVAKRTDRIFWLTTLSELKHQGPLASIWRRPGVSDSQSLIA